MPLIQAKFAGASPASTQKEEIVRKLAHAVRARKRPCAPPCRPSSATPLGVNGARAAANIDIGPLSGLK